MNPLAQIQQAFDDLLYEVAEMKRKLSNVARSGVVKSFDPKTGTAIADIGFETHAIHYASHGGTGKNWSPLKEGQQITVISADGDLANAQIFPGGYHDKNTAPSQSAGEEIVAQRGEGDKAVHLRVTDDSIELNNKAGKSGLLARKGGIVHAIVTDTEKFKIIIGEQAFCIRPEALRPTSPD